VNPDPGNKAPDRETPDRTQYRDSHVANACQPIECTGVSIVAGLRPPTPNVPALSD